MRKELREALERFWRWMSDGAVDAAAAADDPTDHAPDLAAAVASQGVALQTLGQQMRDLAEQVRLLEDDLCAVEAEHGVALEALGQQMRDLAEQVRLLEDDLCAVEAALMDVRPEVES